MFYSTSNILIEYIKFSKKQTTQNDLYTDYVTIEFRKKRKIFITYENDDILSKLAYI